MRQLGYILIVIILSCTDQSDRKSSVSAPVATIDEIPQETENREQPSISIPIVEMTNGLVNALRGEWINTSLFDSTLRKRKLEPWLNEFYGDLLLTIDDSLITIEGNMDGGTSPFKWIDSVTLSMPDRIDEPIFSYSPERDLIIQNPKSPKPIVFRRVLKLDRVDIIANENEFDRFFINYFFDDYMSYEEMMTIKELWNGFRTYTPFQFDALLIEEENDFKWFAWKFNGDTLELYNTSYEYEDDSGFAIYKAESLNKKLIRD